MTPEESFADVIPDLMSRWSIPGGAVGLVKDERIVMAQGYGWADREGQRRAASNSLFRIASLSKPLTAAAVLRLYEQGKLGLDDKPFLVLEDLKPSGSSTIDPRLYEVTVSDLLRHSGGWDRSLSPDPMFMSGDIARAMGVRPPAGAETVISYMFGRPLDFAPGTRYAYSNFGYCLLGRVIERTSGKGYEDFVKTEILNPAGAYDMRLGRTPLAERAENEVAYYDYPGAPLTASVFPEDEDLVPGPYGGFYLEAMDAHGGWLASVGDLLRFVMAVDGRPKVADILSSSSVALMTARPPLPDWTNSAWYYSFGWQVRPTGNDANWWHTGSLPGTATILVRSYNGMAWAALFNSRPADADAFLTELDNALWKAVRAITKWPGSGSSTSRRK